MPNEGENRDGPPLARGGQEPELTLLAESVDAGLNPDPRLHRQEGRPVQLRVDNELSVQRVQMIEDVNLHGWDSE